MYTALKRSFSLDYWSYILLYQYFSVSSMHHSESRHGDYWMRELVLFLFVTTIDMSITNVTTSSAVYGSVNTKGVIL